MWVKWSYEVPWSRYTMRCESDSYCFKEGARNYISEAAFHALTKDELSDILSKFTIEMGDGSSKVVLVPKQKKVKHVG